MAAPASSVPSLKEMVDQGIAVVPPKYVFPVQRRQQPHKRMCAEPPVIDIGSFGSVGNRKSVITEIGDACRDWGFFHVLNFGISLSVVEDVLASAGRFFALPFEERKRYNMDDPREKREACVNWKETIYISSESSAPSFVIEPALRYKEEVKKLGRLLYGAIVESLGATVDEKKAKEHIATSNMLMHYYPPSPDPSCTFGLSEHTDACFITILLQDGVGGLEILKEGCWVPCDPVPGCLTINIADQMEILSNGHYPSVVHRVVCNSRKPRLSVPCFIGPSKDAVIGPLPNLIRRNSPALYKDVIFNDYIQHYMKVRFADTALSGLDFAKLQN